MQTEKVLVVWMFDESDSIKDDLQDLRARLLRVYNELQQARDASGKADRQLAASKDSDKLLTAVTSFGRAFHIHTPQPTSDFRQIIQAFDRIPVDVSGRENLCAAILAAVKQYRVASAKGRRVVLIIVSDESGDDGDLIETALQQVNSIKAPIYFLGREAIFGSPNAYVRFRHPPTGKVFRLPVNRGPEAPAVEQLLYDGFRRRFDSHMSGFGPYEQVRLARNSGGIFFQLPTDGEDLYDFRKQRVTAEMMAGYAPSLASRSVYTREISTSEFRIAIRDAIELLNPFASQNSYLEIPEVEHFAVDPAQSSRDILRRLNQISRVLKVMAAAHQKLDAVQSLRDAESSLRWRANYDLMDAQLMAYRVRLFEYDIALGQFAKNMPRLVRTKNPPHNRWEIRHGADRLLMPDAPQEKALGVTAEQLRSDHREALKLLATVREVHKGTPWATRAEWEEGRRFGATFRSWHLPNAKRRPNPK
jgi:hypothetical protein